LLHNVTKMEQAAHAWMGFHQGVYDYSSNEIKASSPTIRQLLQVRLVVTCAVSSFLFECMLCTGICVHPRIHLFSPTLQRCSHMFFFILLKTPQHEIELRVHSHLPALADKSAASGLLWAKRQIHYQTMLFENISQIPFAFPSSKAAVRLKMESMIYIFLVCVCCIHVYVLTHNLQFLFFLLVLYVYR
jgi:hypothetical protein